MILCQKHCSMISQLPLFLPFLHHRRAASITFISRSFPIIVVRQTSALWTHPSHSKSPFTGFLAASTAEEAVPPKNPLHHDCHSSYVANSFVILAEVRITALSASSSQPRRPLNFLPFALHSQRFLSTSPLLFSGLNSHAILSANDPVPDRFLFFPPHTVFPAPAGVPSPDLAHRYP